MIWFELFIDFFKTGLFSVGGGLATLPFLYDIAAHRSWLPVSLIPDMIAISESTPGPIGVNMATYVGFQAAGVLGAIWATFALVLPSFIIIIIVSKFLEKYSENQIVQSAFSGLRPAVTGLIAAALWQVIKTALLQFDLFNASGQLLDLFNIKKMCIFALATLAVFKFKKHPIIYIAGGAVIGILLKL